MDNYRQSTALRFSIPASILLVSCYFLFHGTQELRLPKSVFFEKIPKSGFTTNIYIKIRNCQLSINDTLISTVAEIHDDLITGRFSSMPEDGFHGLRYVIVCEENTPLVFLDSIFQIFRENYIYTLFLQTNDRQDSVGIPFFLPPGYMDEFSNICLDTNKISIGKAGKIFYWNGSNISEDSLFERIYKSCNSERFHLFFFNRGKENIYGDLVSLFDINQRACMKFQDEKSIAYYGMRFDELEEYYKENGPWDLFQRRIERERKTYFNFLKVNCKDALKIE